MCAWSRHATKEADSRPDDSHGLTETISLSSSSSENTDLCCGKEDVSSLCSLLTQSGKSVIHDSTLQKMEYRSLVYPRRCLEPEH